MSNQRALELAYVNEVCEDRRIDPDAFLACGGGIAQVGIAQVDAVDGRPECPAADVRGGAGGGVSHTAVRAARPYSAARKLARLFKNCLSAASDR
jgi:hypothetical protein